MDSSPISTTETRPKRSPRKFLRWAVTIVLFGLLLYFFWPLLGEIKAVAELFRRADWTWFWIAIGIQMVSYAFLTWLNALSLLPFPGRISFLRLAGVLSSMAFISVAIPSAGLSGIALRVHLLRKYGYAPEESLFSLAVETTLEIVALASVALLGIGYLISKGGLSPFEVFLLAFGGVVILVGIFSAWRLVNHRQQSRILLNRFLSWWNRVGKRLRTFDIPLAEQRLSIFQDNLAKYRTISLGALFIAAYGKVILDVLTMGACFYMFHYPIPPATLFVGYGLTLTSSGLTALPGGLAMTDAIVPVIFTWLNVPAAVAIAAGLTYRLIAFWLVRFVGFISWVFLENRST
jgi:uncharacterized protein (TIRG00374 family)